MKISRQILGLLIVFHSALVSSADNTTPAGHSATQNRSMTASLEESGQSQETEENQVSIETMVNEFLEETALTYAEKGYRSDFKVGNIDPHLSSKKCSTPLSLSMNRRPSEQNRLTIEVKCSDARPWRFYVSTEFNLFAHIVVAAQSIRRGQTLQTHDLAMRESIINKSMYTHYKRIEDVAGMVAKRSIRGDATIQPSHLSPPTLVKRGDDVMIVASNDAISVRMKGTALSDGMLGQQISVKNLKSKRIVRARVSQPGLVKITL